VGWVWVRLLGPVDVWADGVSRPVHGVRRTAVLAALALQPGEIVSTDRLIEVVWGDRPPATAVATLQSNVSYLRRVLGRRAAILGRPPGYLLDIGEEATDVQAAQRLIRQGSQSGDPDQRQSRLQAAVALWRGRPLADLAGLAWFDEHAEWLQQLLAEARQGLIDTRLSLGHHTQLIPELETLVRQYPLHEHFHGQLMLALYRAGRQGEALAAYQRLRRTLGEDLGIDPSQPLRELETAILRQDPALDVPRAAANNGLSLAALAAQLHDAGAVLDRDRDGDPAGDIESSLLAGERALFVEGDLEAGRRWFGAAYRGAEGQGDGLAMARAALGLGGLWVHQNRTAVDTAVVRSRQRHALSLIDPQSSLAFRLRARLAAEEAFRTGDYEAVMAMLAEARRRDDAVSLAEVLSLVHQCAGGPGGGALRLELAQELIGVASRTNRRGDLLIGLLWQTIDLFMAADPHAERTLAELRGLLARKEHLAVGFIVSGVDVMLSIRSGRLAQAEALAAACAQRGTAIGDHATAARYAAHMATIRWYQGRIGELVPLLSEWVHSPKLAANDEWPFAVLAAALATTGERSQAASMLARLRGRSLADMTPSSAWLATLHCAVEAADLLDDADTAGEAYALLAPFADLPVIGGFGVTCMGSARHALGVASLTSGRIDRAVEHLQAAIHDNLVLGHMPAMLLSRARLGQALTLREAPRV
jgi:DNA-binding SARP family transcriptional activator